MSTRLAEFEKIPPSVIGMPIENTTLGLSDEAKTLAELDRRSIENFLFPVTTLELCNQMRFRYLVENWRINTATSSSIDEIISDENFVEIVGLGDMAISLILSEIRMSPSLLFVALQQITGENPVSEEHRGDISAMTHDWLDWGAQKGIL